jgi:competence protein ComEC
VAAAALVVWRVPVIRPAAALTSALIVAVILVPLGPSVDVPAVVFLDVGQGDATLVLADGVTILVDGGPDPVVLRRKLDHYRVDRIDLLVVSHVHADHIEGLRAVVGTTPVGAAWTAFDGHDTPASRWLTEALADAGIPNQTPPAGSVVEAGGLAIEVLAPRRRYASPNDQSIVLMLRAAGRSFLLSGDIEVVAQRELGVVNADVLKVPHQGAATSDPDWIAAAAPELAIVFVGPNDYGHPADWVIESLESSGAIVKRTDRDGDIVVEP